MEIVDDCGSVFPHEIIQRLAKNFPSCSFSRRQVEEKEPEEKADETEKPEALCSEIRVVSRPTGLQQTFRNGGCVAKSCTTERMLETSKSG